MSATPSILVRRVMQTFEVRQVTEDNAVELALWLRDEGKKYGVSDGRQPVVSYAGEKPVLVPDPYMGHGQAPVGAWVGWGWPRLTHEGDIPLPHLLVINGEVIEAERFDQGFEEVRLG